MSAERAGRGGLDSIRGGAEEEREFRRFGGREIASGGAEQGRGRDGERVRVERWGETQIEEMMSRLVLCGSREERTAETNSTMHSDRSP